MSEPTYSIGELAEQTGLSIHTLRWYESQGLFPGDIPRTSGGRRRYPAASLSWLAFIGRLRESGMPVASMARYADLVRAGDGNEADRLALLEQHADALAAQIAELVSAQRVIGDKVAAYRALLRQSSGQATAALCPGPTPPVS